jgi:DNA-binding transcriptional MerR regulator
MKIHMSTDPGHSNYRIGAVSRLTGIPPDTLRVWERRYALVKPIRSEGGGRLYAQEDITRLGVIKRLVDSGHAIGTIAELSLEQLNQRLADTRLTDQPQPPSRPVRLAIIGDTLPALLRPDIQTEECNAIDVVGSYRSRVEWLSTPPVPDLDVLVVELATLDGDSATDIGELSRRSGASNTLVVFGFGSSRIVSQLVRAGITAVRFPVTWDEIRALAVAPGQGGHGQLKQMHPDLAPVLLEAPPGRLYDNHQLAAAIAESTGTECECPHHLADLIISLNHFEEYSSLCRTQRHEDAALHAYLHLMAAKARSLMEQALQKAIDGEGIDLNTPRSES